MKIVIVGAGNMGGAIASGLAHGGVVSPKDIVVIDHSGKNVHRLRAVCPDMEVVVADYSPLFEADVIILAVKPWHVQDFLSSDGLNIREEQILISVAANISLDELKDWTSPSQALIRMIPNTAIAVKQSMTYLIPLNVSEDKLDAVIQIFKSLGKVELIEEKLIPAVTSLTSCGIAFAFRYIRAAMEGGVEMGLYPDQAKEAVLQTLKGAVELLEANNSHPEAEVDKVTTAGGITIKGLNEMEHAGFSSSVIRGLKASCIK